jgi:hypothetical protein
VLHTLPISFSLTRSFWLFLARSTSYEASNYAVFFNLPSPVISSLFERNILVSTLFSNILSLR